MNVQPRMLRFESVNLTPASHSGLTLTPGVAKKIIVGLFKSEPRWTTAKLIQKVPEIHSEQGGGGGKDSVKNVINKALGYLKEDGFIHRKDYGVWEKTDEDFEAAELEEERPQLTAATEAKIKVGKTLGEGPESMYVYYHDSDRKLPVVNGDPVWPCKIGESGTSDPVERVITQCGTSRHTLPEIPLVIKSEDSEGIEKLIHRVFRLAGLWIKNEACSDEWFKTNPQQVEACYAAINDCIVKLRPSEQAIGG
jgi:hypothetical protein